MRNSIIEALEIATEEFKEEEKRRPGRPRKVVEVFPEQKDIPLPMLGGGSAEIASRYGWTVGQRDMAIKMQMEHRSLSEIKAEIGKPAEEIARVLLLNVKRSKAGKNRIPDDLILRISSLIKDGFKCSVVADILNADDVPSASGRPWTKTMINSALHRRHKKQGVPS